MESFDWNPEKNDRLKRTRSIDFEDVVFHVQNGDLLAILEHPNPKRYPNQRVMALDINGYAHLGACAAGIHGCKSALANSCGAGSYALQLAACCCLSASGVMSIQLKTSAEIEKMRVAGRLAAEVLEMIGEHVRAGVSTGELDRICHRHIVEKQGAIPAPLNYRGFPRATCISVNHVVCHGIPSERKILKNGDILNIDITVIKDGFHGDTSKMFFVGNAPEHARRLVRVARECLFKGIEAARPGARLGDIGHIIQRHGEAHHYGIVREYCGHGIGRAFHEDPQVLHYGTPGTGVELEAGMTFTIEPMLNAGTRHTRLSTQDGWTVTTRDRRLSAQWEHTIAIHEGGCEVLTLREEER